MTDLDIKCINLQSYPTQEAYICLMQTDGYRRVIPLYRLLSPEKLTKLDILFRECRIKGDEWLSEIDLSEEEILSLYFDSPEGKAETLFIELVNAGLLPKPENGFITLNSDSKTYKIEIETLKLFIDGKESCFQCENELPHFDRLISLCLTILHDPKKLERR